MTTWSNTHIVPPRQVSRRCRGQNIVRKEQRSNIEILLPLKGTRIVLLNFRRLCQTSSATIRGRCARYARPRRDQVYPEGNKVLSATSHLREQFRADGRLRYGCEN